MYAPHCAVLLVALSALAGGMSAESAEEAGPDIVVVAEAAIPDPATLPTIRVVREKLWGKYYPMV